MADLDGYGEGIRPADGAARAEAETKHADELSELRLLKDEEFGELVHKMNRREADHVVIVEKMRADNSEAIQATQARASERVDGAQERVKVIEHKVKEVVEEARVAFNDMVEQRNADKESAQREIHAQGKTIARMKGEIQHLQKRLLERMLGHSVEEPPDADPVSEPGKNEETD